MLINQNASLTYYEHELSQELKQTNKIEPTENKAIHLESNLPIEYIPDSELSEEELIERKVFEQILNTYSSTPLKDEDYWKYNNENNTQAITDAKDKIKNALEELHSAKMDPKSANSLNYGENPFIKVIKPSYQTEIGFSGIFDIHTSQNKYNINISFNFTQNYRKVDDANSSIENSNILNLRNIVDYKNIKIDISKMEENNSNTLSLENLNNLLDSEGEAFNEVFTGNSNSYFKVINNYKSDTAFYKFI